MFRGGRARGSRNSTNFTPSRGSYSNYTSNNPRGRGRGGRGGARGGGPRAPRGLFINGVWHCDCQPQRLPAEHFQVKKEGPNKGRWFYTCQKTAEQRCGFFLWQDDAAPREEAAVLGNSRSEPVAADATTPYGLKDRKAAAAEAPQEGWSAGRRGQTASAPKPAQAADDSETENDEPPPRLLDYSHTPSKAGSKRPAQIAFDDSDEDFDMLDGVPLTSNQIHELERTAAAAAASQRPPHETPHKAPKTGVYATPATSVVKSKRTLPWEDRPAMGSNEDDDDDRLQRAPTESDLDEPPTPSKRPAAKLPPVSNGNAHMTQKQTQPEPHTSPIVQRPTTPEIPTVPVPAEPPTPQTSRHKDALSNPSDSNSSLTAEALSCLHSTSSPIPASTLTALRGILTKHDLRTQGIAMGRDVARKALRAKDARIAELQARIASLQAEREVDAEVIKQLRWERENDGVH